MDTNGHQWLGQGSKELLDRTIKQTIGLVNFSLDTVSHPAIFSNKSLGFGNWTLGFSTGMPAPENERGQMMLAEEYFAAENDLFLETLRRVSQPKTLAGFTDRWKKDPRPWARRQIFAYLRQPLNCPGHQPVVKRLFKHAEENKD